MRKIIIMMMILINAISVFAFFDNPFSILDISDLENIEIKIDIINKEQIFCLQNGNCTLQQLTVNNLTVINITNTSYLCVNDICIDDWNQVNLSILGPLDNTTIIREYNESWVTKNQDYWNDTDLSAQKINSTSGNFSNLSVHYLGDYLRFQILTASGYGRIIATDNIQMWPDKIFMGQFYSQGFILADNKEWNWGGSADFSRCYVSATNTLNLVEGGSCTSNIRLTLDTNSNFNYQQSKVTNISILKVDNITATNVTAENVRVDKINPFNGAIPTKSVSFFEGAGGNPQNPDLPLVTIYGQVGGNLGEMYLGITDPIALGEAWATIWTNGNGVRIPEVVEITGNIYYGGYLEWGDHTSAGSNLRISIDDGGTIDTQQGQEIVMDVAESGNMVFNNGLTGAFKFFHEGNVFTIDTTNAIFTAPDGSAIDYSSGSAIVFVGDRPFAFTNWVTSETGFSGDETISTWYLNSDDGTTLQGLANPASITLSFGSGATEFDNAMCESYDFMGNGARLFYIDSGQVCGTRGIFNELNVIIDDTNTEALLVRKNGDGGDVLTVDTTSSIVTITGTETVTGRVTGNIGFQTSNVDNTEYQFRTRSDSGMYDTNYNIDIMTPGDTIIHIDANANSANSIFSIVKEQATKRSRANELFYVSEDNYSAFSGDLDIGGDSDVNGNFTGNQIYGEMWFHNDSSMGIQTTIASSGVWYNITGFNQLTESGGFLNGFTKTQNHLSPLIDGKYKVCYSYSFGNSGNNQEYQIAIDVNGDIKDQTEAHRKIGSGGDVGNAGGCGIIQLSTNDIIHLQILNADGTANVFSHASNVNLMRVGD